MQPQFPESEQNRDPQSLEAADAIARAAHLWIRSLCNRFATDEADRLATAGGLLAGLCERLELDPGVTDLVAYVYMLLDDQGSQALPISKIMLNNPGIGASRLGTAYQRGRDEAAAIVEMLAFHRRR